MCNKHALLKGMGVMAVFYWHFLEAKYYLEWKFFLWYPASISLDSIDLRLCIITQYTLSEKSSPDVEYEVHIFLSWSSKYNNIWCKSFQISGITFLKSKFNVTKSGVNMYEQHLKKKSFARWNRISSGQRVWLDSFHSSFLLMPLRCWVNYIHLPHLLRLLNPAFLIAGSFSNVVGVKNLGGYF